MLVPLRGYFSWLMLIVFTLISCVLFMALVGGVSYWKTRGGVQTREGYFLAGRGLSGVFIAGSLLLTNLSAEQLIGLNGSAYGFNMTAMAWEVTAGFAIIVMALVFLPRYLGGAFSTLPQFLADRFDDGVRRLTVVLFLLGYGLITIPSILYSGSLAVLRLFDVPGVFGIGFEASLIGTIFVIGVIGGIYAVFGGLKAVAVSDTLNGVGLLIVGDVPFSLAALGDGDAARWRVVSTEETHKLNAVVLDDRYVCDLIYRHDLANLLLGYKSVRYSALMPPVWRKVKGVLLSGFFKLLPFFMMLPRVIAFHLYGSDLHIDLAYPTWWLMYCLFIWAASFSVLLGAVFTVQLAAQQCSDTVLPDIYQPMFKPQATDAH